MAEQVVVREFIWAWLKLQFLQGLVSVGKLIFLVQLCSVYKSISGLCVQVLTCHPCLIRISGRKPIRDLQIHNALCSTPGASKLINLVNKHHTTEHFSRYHTVNDTAGDQWLGQIHYKLCQKYKHGAVSYWYLHWILERIDTFFTCVLLLSVVIAQRWLSAGWI